ncbi:hypothetical protein FK535_07460 [Mycolicibacterium sp. 018/SC-01/001]|uniref:DUF7159 family protein n=1 Tax=Mycolicibacterium sp. 018/SC-01/001 TaxID=2592069 RepID=UPI001181428E|nr:hypothetical protein [Mycolicibacterium sp. 018/SC-01/001]TRW86293.1 hypothetical protein FK535_07460 [Mycolicibacterium sp. 018/SC-01/001]
MDLVLGLSMTSSSVRWVLVEGAAGDGATLDRGSADLAGLDAGALLDSLIGDDGSRRLHAVGLTWSPAAESAASAAWQALTDRGVENVIAVSDVEAAETLALGIADVAGHERVSVYVAEPEESLLVAATPDGVTADRAHPGALAETDLSAADAVIVLGSGDVAGAMAALQPRTDVAVVSADQAELALARGAALAAASAVALLDVADRSSSPRLTATAVLASVLAAAVVTLVVSVSAAVGLSLTPDPAPEMVRSVQAPAPEAARPERDVAPPAAPPPAPAAPVVNEVPAPQAVEVPAAPPADVPVPAEAAPVVEAPPAAPPPPAPENDPAPLPDYLPPAPGAPVLVPPGGPLPAAVPPPVVVDNPQPRLRDRIIERIPIINRFHEPQYDYTP